MDQIFHQLGGLALGSLPTVVLFVLLITAYEVLVRRPLEKMLGERNIRTTGAVNQARAALSAAEAETLVYEDRLRSAKAELFAAREQRLKRWGEEREAALVDAQQRTQERVKTARLEIEESVSGARIQIEAVSDELSARVLRAVLPKAMSMSEAGQ